MSRIQNHVMPSVRYVPSPNHGERPDTEDISLMVFHSISLPPGEYRGDAVERFFMNELPADEHPYFEEIAELTVSAHLFIRRTGEIIQFVPFNRRAWHAGRSIYQGRENCNDFSIGIELEGTDTDVFEHAQYQALVDVVNTLVEYYPKLSAEHITGHSDIAPGRKTDPGTGFDWQVFRKMLAS